ncbi:hypothetical protein [Streptomyces sp. uw30]|nr:hypothetical protein [Streptomyces sp. uw30]
MTIDDTGGFGVGAEVTRTAYFLARRIDKDLRDLERRLASPTE